jgi:chromosomal replication initiator protein|tara:strand:+ start:19919 stop:21283 length:1365 start_codon:yes stop_codon:yes gene_type:complete
VPNTAPTNRILRENIMEKTVWDQCLNELKTDLSESQFNTWIRPLIYSRDEHSDTITLFAPNKFVVDWVEKNYLGKIKSIAQEAGAQTTSVAVLVGEVQPDAVEKTPLAATSNKVTGTPLNPLYTFKNFVGGKSNQIARAAALQISENPGQSYNPFFIYGGVGLGKTHLMQSVGNEIKSQNSNRRISYVHSERFVGEMVSAIQHNNLNSFKNDYRSLDVLLIDDIQFLAGKEKSQEEFFHTFNVLIESGSQIIITSDKFPKEIKGLEERLRSRFGWGLTVSIDPPEMETSVAILLVKSALEGFSLPEDVAFFICEHIRSNVRELEGALRKIIATSRFTGVEPSVDMARECLKDLLSLQSRTLTTASIQKVVAEYYNIRVADLHSKKRSRSITRPRQLAMAVTKELTTYSLPEIGDSFGGRDHTTVIHACKKIAELRTLDITINEDYKNILRLLCL